MSYNMMRERIATGPPRPRHARSADPPDLSDLEEPVIVRDKEAVGRAVVAVVSLLRRSSTDDFERMRELVLRPDVRATPCSLGRRLIQTLAQPPYGRA